MTRKKLKKQSWPRRNRKGLIVVGAISSAAAGLAWMLESQYRKNLHN